MWMALANVTSEMASRLSPPTGKRSRGWSLQERAFTPVAEAQARSGGRGSGSLSGSDAQQPSSERREAALHVAAKPLRRESLEAEATSVMCSAHAAAQPQMQLLRQRDLQDQQQNLPPQHEPQQQRQQLQQSTADLRQDCQQHAAEPPQQCTGALQPRLLRAHEQQPHQARRPHHSHQHQCTHQQQHPQPHASQQKAILPGVLASLVQTHRSSQRTFPAKPPRPPLGPSAPSKRRRCDADATEAAADGPREGVGTSQPPISSLLQQKAGQMRPALQRRPAQQRNGHDGRPVPRNLSVQVPLADPVHLQLHGFFSRRRQQLRQLGRRPSRYTRPPQAGPRSGLLAFPEDVLVSVL